MKVRYGITARLVRAWTALPAIAALSALSALLALSTLGSRIAQAAEVTLRVGNVYPATHSIPVATEEFKKLVEQKSKGRIAVQVFNNSELGSEREMAEMTRNGSLEMVLSGLPGTGAYAPEIEVMEAFYIYKNVEDLARISAAIRPDLQEFLLPRGFVLVGMMYQGPRITLSTKPLKTIDDFKGLRLRVPQTPLFVSLARAWGATPTAISLTEVYTSLESGVINAMEATAETIVTSNFHEKAKYLLMTRHNFYPQPMVVNRKWFEALPKDLQDAIVDAAREAGQFQLKLHKGAEEKAMAAMKAAGVTITEPADIKSFRDPLIAMDREYFKAKGPKVDAVFQKMLSMSSF
jgi:tripartite ATP-independent transporter DctP family solute receptor